MVGLSLLAAVPRGDVECSDRADPVAQSGVPAARNQPPTFRTKVEVVEIDLLALDAAGRSVTDLRREEFEVFENGTRREVASFSLVNLPVAPPHRVSAPDVASNADSDRGRLVFLILDDVHTLKERTASIQAAARRLLERLSPSDRVAVAWLSLGTSGAREFTADHAAALEAVMAVDARGTRVARRNPSEIPLPDLRGHDLHSEETRELGLLNVGGVFESARPFTMVRDVADYMAGLPHRRKAILYVGDGPPVSFDPEQADVATGAGNPFYLDVVRAINAARRANVAFYAMSPSQIVAPTVEGQDASERTLREVAQCETALSALSKATGGFAASGPRVLDSIDRVVREMSTYYLLGYYAEPAKAPTGLRAILPKALWNHFRPLEVRTTRPGVRIVARKGYWPDPASPGPPAVTDAAGKVADSVRGLVPASELSLRAMAVPFRGTGSGGHDVAVIVEVIAPSLMPAALGEPLAEDVEMLMVPVQPGRGERASERIRTRIEIGTPATGGLVAPRYLLGATLALPPARYQLRLGVRSSLARKLGSVYVDVAVPGFEREPVSLSGILLSRGGGRPLPVAASKSFKRLVVVTPTLDREFHASDDVVGSVRVYRGKGSPGDAVRVTARIVREGETPTAGGGDVLRPAQGEVVGAATEYRFALPLAGLEPGGYRLVVEAGRTGGPASSRRELDFRVLAEEPETVSTAPSTLGPSALTALIDAASRYAVNYLERLSSVVAEESYEQELDTGTANSTRRYSSRTLRSDFLLVRVPGQTGLTPFRDVFEVDGHPVGDRQERLLNLFLAGRPEALDRARRVLDEGARFNLGTVYRNFNHVVLPLVFLLPEMRGRFVFEARGEERLEVGSGRRVDYVETARPTLLRQETSSGNLPASGSFWIENGTGRVLGSVLRTGDATFVVEATAVYREDTDLGLLVPAEMRELYKMGFDRRQQVRGLATYRNFRRFQVSTEERITVK